MFLSPRWKSPRLSRLPWLPCRLSRGWTAGRVPYRRLPRLQWSLRTPQTRQASVGSCCLVEGLCLSWLTSQRTCGGNLVLKRRDALLSRLTQYVDSESFLSLRNGPLLGSPFLFARDRVDVAVDRRRSGENDLLVHQVVASAPRGHRGTTAKPPRSADTPAAAPRKPQPSKVSRKGAQPSSMASAKKVPIRNFQPSSSGKKGGKGKKRGGGGPR